MIAPGVVEHHATFGATYAVSSGVGLTFACMRAFENTVEGESSIPDGFGGGEADLTMSQDSFGLGLGVLFQGGRRRSMDWSEQGPWRSVLRRPGSRLWCC
jgi:hypothetical protein